MFRKILLILITLSAWNLQAQTVADGMAKLKLAREYEERLYPTFTMDIFNKTVDAYHQAGETFLHLLNTTETDKIKNSYYALYSWLQESELLEALNRTRPICDVYVNTFDQLIPANRFKDFKQTEINQLQYDTTYTKTLWLLFYKTQECHKDLFTVKYGELLKKYITRTDKLMPDVYIAMIQANTNIDLFTEAYQAYQDFTSKCKGIKLNDDQKSALHKAVSELKMKGSEALSPSEKKELDKC